MREIMYSQSSVLIVSGLFIFMLLAMEIGFRSSRHKQTTTEAITQVNATEPALHESLLHQAKLMEAQLWSHAVRAAELDKSVVTSGLFIQSLNELIDTSATRDAALNRLVPEIVLLLMLATIVLTTATLGYASGIAGHRVTLAAFVLVTLMALVVYLIIDLDRPRRGAIQVSHESMLNLQQTIGTAEGHAAQPGSPPGASQAPRR